MTSQTTSDLRKLSDDELTNKISELRRELFDLRFKQATKQLNQTHQFKLIRKNLAQLMTIYKERNSSLSSQS